jgi:hypothetical protein
MKFLTLVSSVLFVVIGCHTVEVIDMDSPEDTELPTDRGTDTHIDDDTSVRYESMEEYLETYAAWENTHAEGDIDSSWCDGPDVWFDEISGNCWQNDGHYPVLSPEEASEHCANMALGELNGWYLPDVKEMASLMRGCVNGSSSAYMLPSNCEFEMDTSGRFVKKMDCGSCMAYHGPREDGCYLPHGIDDMCEEWEQWRTASYYQADHPIVVLFSMGYFSYGSDAFKPSRTRCVFNP